MRIMSNPVLRPYTLIFAAGVLLAGCANESQITSLPGSYAEKLPEIAERIIDSEGGLLDDFRGYRDYYFIMASNMQGLQAASNQPPLKEEDLDVFKMSPRMIAGTLGVKLDETKFWDEGLSDSDEDAMFEDLRKQLLNKLPKFWAFKDKAPTPLTIADDLSFSYQALNPGYRGEVYQCTAPDIDLLNQAGQLPLVCQDDDGIDTDGAISTDGQSITIEMDGDDLGRRYYPASGS